MSEQDPNALLLLGEIRGQLRELIHSTNNNATKLDALSLRVSALETDKSRREGQASVLQTILRSPGLAWLISAIITAWAVLSGRVEP
ncbi:MAG TPA: hypothetical protein VFS91_00085 [Nitrobacter sp.]|nr:hypothetical protein [Nitrobacter sp.]